MAAVDAANLALEGGQPNVVTLAGLLAPGGFVDGTGRPDVVALREVLAPRIERVDALHRVPARLDGVWRWRTAVPDLSHHLRVIEADIDLEHTCSRVVMTPLDPARPLWELLLVPRVAEGRCGMLFRLHHAVADGLGAEALVAALSDAAPVDDAPAGAAHGRADEPPPAARRPLLRRWGDLAVQTAAVFRRSVHSRALLGPLGTTRDVALLDVDLARLHDGAHLLGGTIGDAFLAAFGQGLRAMLAAAGEEPPAAVPVSSPVRLARLAGEGNATGVMLTRIPVADLDVDRAVARVASLTRSEKARARAVGTFRPMSNPRAARMLMHLARRQRAVGAIASELTGPERTLRLGGAELVAAWPLALLSGNVRVGALAVSYAGRFRVSIQTDGSHLPPARVLADGMARALGGIEERARQRAPG